MAKQRTIKLKLETWVYEQQKPFAQGAFGRVFLGRSVEGKAVAVKQMTGTGLGLDQRELRVADELVGRKYAHVVEVLDYGIDLKTGGYFIVMPLAELDLDAFIKEQGPQDSESALRILEEVALGLSECPVIHRDLKPRNILRDAGSWKIADFGIARFFEEATSSHTLKQHMSAEYAAPEQWRQTTATRATDIYALGCIGHFLLTGNPPFKGPDRDDYARQHLEECPPALNTDGGLQQLLTKCLSKLPESRPDNKSVIATLGSLIRGGGRKPNPILLEIGAKLAQERVAAEAAASAAEARERRRRALRAVAASQFEQSTAALVQSIRDAISDATLLSDISELRAGNGVLFWRPIGPVEEATFARSGKRIVAAGILGVTQPGTTFRGRSANLWFADWENSGSVRWWEVAYISMRGQPRISPFGVEEPQFADADQTHGGVMGTLEVDGQPVPIDGEYEDAFLQRWQDRFAQAVRTPVGGFPRW